MVGVTKSKRDAEQSFHEALDDGGWTPEKLLLAVMRGQETIYVTRDGETETTKRAKKISREMKEAAMALLPYRLPKLNSIDAVQRNVETTHEDWLKSLDLDDET